MSESGEKDIKQNGYELRIGRYRPNERRKPRWVVFNEDGVSFENPVDEEPNVLAPVGAALSTAFPSDDRIKGVGVTVGGTQERRMSAEYFTEFISVYVTREGMYKAVDESGDVGVGGSLVEAVYNTGQVIELMNRFEN